MRMTIKVTALLLSPISLLWLPVGLAVQSQASLGIFTSSRGEGGLLPLSDKCFCQLDGVIDDCSCKVDTGLSPDISLSDT